MCIWRNTNPDQAACRAAFHPAKEERTQGFPMKSTGCRQGATPARGMTGISRGSHPKGLILTSHCQNRRQVVDSQGDNPSAAGFGKGWARWVHACAHPQGVRRQPGPGAWPGRAKKWPSASAWPWVYSGCPKHGVLLCCSTGMSTFSVWQRMHGPQAKGNNQGFPSNSTAPWVEIPSGSAHGKPGRVFQ